MTTNSNKTLSLSPSLVIESGSYRRSCCRTRGRARELLSETSGMEGNNVLQTAILKVIFFDNKLLLLLLLLLLFLLLLLALPKVIFFDNKLLLLLLFAILKVIPLDNKFLLLLLLLAIL